MTRLRIAMAQVNVTVGDFQANRRKIAQFLTGAKKASADGVLFPELTIPGYPPEDLLFKPAFVEENEKTLRALLPLTQGITAVIGFVEKGVSGRLYNAAAIAADGRLAGVYRKIQLPNYGVFDEKRYFTAGQEPLVLELKGEKIGISVCEDIWVEEGPCQDQARAGAKLLINIAASPYHALKRRVRERLLSQRARSYKSWVCYTNLVGGQDELVFDGGSLLVNPAGQIVFRAPQFKEGLFVVEIPKDSMSFPPSTVPLKGGIGDEDDVLSPSVSPLPPDEEIFEALVLGTRDYFEKNRFSHAVLGLSGGIDSALAAAVAAAALGRGAVTGVSMPSRYSSVGTRADAKGVAKALGIEFLEISIEPIFKAFLKCLKPPFGNRRPDVTEENLQARIRGTILMALSNKFGWLVLATGNKSEISTGYCTLYGDMVGGFAVIKDLPKTQVYRLSRTANRRLGKTVIPPSVFKRPPTAELRPRQRDQDTLPPYGRLDSIIRAYVEEDRPARRISKLLRISRREVDDVIRMIDRSEYKRRQAPPGIKITPRAFGRDRRMPITNRFREKGA